MKKLTKMSAAQERHRIVTAIVLFSLKQRHPRLESDTSHLLLRRPQNLYARPSWKLDPGYLPFLMQIALAKGLKNKFDIEVEIALLVYEDALSLDSSRRIRANRTRPLLKTYGVTAGLAKVVFGNHKKKIGWGRLADSDLLKYSFEQVILDFQDHFQYLDDFEELIYICKTRLQKD